MLPMITSSANQRIKGAAALRDSRKRRQRHEFLIDGIREITRAQASGIAIREIYTVASARASKTGEHLCGSEQLQVVNEFEERRIPVWPVAEEVFGKLAFGDRNEGIVALAAEPERSFDRFAERLPKNPLLCVLEGIEKPGNIGAVFRSADGAGLDGIILADCGQDLYHPNTIRASLGTVFAIPSVSAPSDEAAAWLRTWKIRVVSAICDAEHSYSDIDYRPATAIALGSEAFGLTNLWRGRTNGGADGSGNFIGVSLPMRGIADSLNISNAAAIMFYNAILQRNKYRQG